MFSPKYADIHRKIRNWNTETLIETLEGNELYEFSELFRKRQIDGESFLDLNEFQLKLWRNVLNNMQIKKLWKIVQLAQQNPYEFVLKTNTQIPKQLNIPTNNENIEKINSPIADELENILEEQINITDNHFSKEIQKKSNDLRRKQLPPKPSHLQNQNTTKYLPQPPNNITSFDDVNENLISNEQFEKIKTTENSLVQNKSYLHTNVQNISDSHFSQEIQKKSDNLRRKQLPAKPVHLQNQNNLPELPKNITSFGQLLDDANDVLNNDRSEKAKIIESRSYLHTNIQKSEEPLDIPTIPLSPVSKREPVPIPKSLLSRPLPEIPKDEQPYPLPPNVVPIQKPSKQDLPLPPPPFNLATLPELPDIPDEMDFDYYDSFESPEPIDYRTQTWYKDIDRKEANSLLQGKPNGTFIVRPSKQLSNECSFSVICNNRIYNLAIMKENDKLVLGRNSFANIFEIIDLFSTTDLILNGPNNEDIFVKLRKFS